MRLWSEWNRSGISILSLFIFFLFAMFVGSCSQPTTVLATEQKPPTPSPTTILEPAIDFTPGSCDKPEGEYLFLKVSSHNRCSPKCDCPEIEPPSPAINRDGEDVRYFYEQVIGSFEPWNPKDPAIGLLIDGWFEDKLYVIDGLPFDIAGSRVRLQSCKNNGTAVVEIGGEVYEIPPNKGWSSQMVQDEGGGCYITWTLSVRNDGLIEKWHFKSDLSVQDEFLRLEVKDKHFSPAEEIALDFIVIGEKYVDVSGWCSMAIEMRDGNSWSEVGECSQVPDYVPEPFPRQPGDIFEITMPHSTLGLEYPYQYDLIPGNYRIRITYQHPEGSTILYSAEFRITQR